MPLPAIWHTGCQAGTTESTDWRVPFRGEGAHPSRAMPPFCSAAPFVISLDGCVQIRPIWRLFGPPDTTAYADERKLHSL
jgi:hypothetical protein